MVDFNNTLESAVKSVLKWEEKQIITETTIIRDVQGKAVSYTHLTLPTILLV